MRASVNLCSLLKKMLVWVTPLEVIFPCNHDKERNNARSLPRHLPSAFLFRSWVFSPRCLRGCRGVFLSQESQLWLAALSHQCLGKCSLHYFLLLGSEAPYYWIEHIACWTNHLHFPSNSNAFTLVPAEKAPREVTQCEVHLWAALNLDWIPESPPINCLSLRYVAALVAQLHPPYAIVVK